MMVGLLLLTMVAMLVMIGGLMMLFGPDVRNVGCLVAIVGFVLMVLFAIAASNAIPSSPTPLG